MKLEEYVSIGTRFSDRTVVDSPVPIDIVTSQELSRGGATETGQVLQALVPSFNFPRATIADGTDHIRPATLRGLAPDQTLVLVNGKRRHTSSLVNVNGTVGRGSVSMDFNAIPTGAIGRVEVLRDGASAQYGSDAIAGVINIVLDRSLGFGGSATYGGTKEGDGQVVEASIFGGVPLGDKGVLHLTMFYRDREDTNRSAPDTRQQYFGTSTTTGGAVAINGNFGSGFTPTSGNGTSAATAPTTAFTLDPREQTINRVNHRQGDAATTDQGVFFDAEVPIAAALKVYAFGGYTARDGESAGFFRRAGDDRTVRAIYPNGFLPLINSDITDASLGGGIKGESAGWDWDLSSVYGVNTFKFTITDTANATLGSTSPTRFYAGKLGFDQWTSNLDLSNRFDFGWHAPLKVALGAEFRRDHYKIGAGEPDSYRNGGVTIQDGPSAGGLAAPGAQVFPGFRPSDAVDKSRTSTAVYADVENSITEKLLLSAAGRFEDYSDFGSQFTVKGSGRFSITPELGLRGSVSTGFRAPHLAQQWFSSTATNFIGGVPFDNKTFPVADPVARLLGAKDLKPETAVNVSLGTTWQHGGFSSSIDFYRIEIDDRIVLSSTFIDPSGVSLIKNFLAANGQSQAIGGRFFTNAVDTRTEGVDLTARYLWKTASAGNFTVTAGYNHNTTKVTRFSDTPAALKTLTLIPLFDLTEKTRMEKGQPRDIVNLSANWDFKRWSVLVREVRYGEVTAAATDNSGWTPARIAALTPGYDVSFAPAVPSINAAGQPVPTSNLQVFQTFDAKWLTDIDVTFHFTKNFSVSVGANNVFDIYPKKNIASTIAYQGSDNVGIFPYNGVSPFGFNGAFYYVKVAYKF